MYNDDCKIIYIEGKLKYHVIEGLYDEMGGGSSLYLDCFRLEMF